MATLSKTGGKDFTPTWISSRGNEEKQRAMMAALLESSKARQSAGKRALAALPVVDGRMFKGWEGDDAFFLGALGAFLASGGDADTCVMWVDGISGGGTCDLSLLMAACTLGLPRTADALLAAGADPRTVNSHGVSALAIMTRKLMSGKCDPILLQRLLVASGGDAHSSLFGDPRIQAIGDTTRAASAHVLSSLLARSPTERRRELRRAIRADYSSRMWDTPGTHAAASYCSELVPSSQQPSGFRDPVASVSLDALFSEMRVVRLADFLAAGQLTCFDSAPRGRTVFAADLPEGSRVVFVSHRWLSPSLDQAAAHPDDKAGSKWAQICAATRGMAAESTYLWVDYCCYAQRDFAAMLRGVRSLVFYVACADAFLAVHHDEYWGRAWCRLEAFAAVHFDLPLRECVTPDGETRPLLAGVGDDVPDPRDGALTNPNDSDNLRFLAYIVRGKE